MRLCSITEVGAVGVSCDGAVLALMHMRVGALEVPSTASSTAAGDRLGYVHVGESHRGYLGTGNVDFDAFFGALKQINYTGPIAFESFSSAVVDPALSDALRIWRNLWTDSDDLATKALAYMKERY